MIGNDRRGILIQERDQHLLREVALMRVIDREQAKLVAGFGSTTRANVRLLGLTRVGLLKRFFLGTTAGGRKALYAISAKGAQLVGLPARGPRRRNDEALATDFFVQHQLAVNDIYCPLKYRPVPLAGVTFGRWLNFYEPLTSALRLIPDGYLELQTPAGIAAFFLEVDLGHEGLSVWKEKVRNYLQFALSGEFERRFGVSRFRVLVLANSERRLMSIRKAIVAATEKIFWLATVEAVNRGSFFSSIWLRPKGEDRLPLIQGNQKENP
ncbi:MAG: replication-relaxation family protein [Terriglobales bacterium]